MVVRITILRCIESQKIADLTSQLVTHFQQSQFFSWWKTNTVVNNTLLGSSAAKAVNNCLNVHKMCRSFVFWVAVNVLSHLLPRGVLFVLGYKQIRASELTEK